MARKSRKNIHKTADAVEAALILKYMTGIYARLSIEDNGDKTKDSIQNQVTFLQEYVKAKEEEFQLVQIYVDNGTTGTNFDRENWNRLMADIKCGKINCVIVKDFSRIGRNYIEVGNYLEKIFPFLGVRVISVNDNFDSSRQSFQSDMLINSLTNIVNEYYARDISRKVTQTKRTMQKNGEYVSSILPYGYKRSDTDRKKLVVDSECADIVKKIFIWRAGGKGCVWIANYLNELALPSPGLYRYLNGHSGFKRSLNVKWKSKHVAGILTNPVYLGHMVQGKTRCSYFEQEGKLRVMPKEDWVIVEHSHEPLVTREQFDIAARMADDSKERHRVQMNAHTDIPHFENPLRKKIYCGQCGSLLTRRSRVKEGVRGYCFYCHAPLEKINAACTNTYIHELPLMEAIRTAADQQLRLLGAWQSQWSKQKNAVDFIDKNSRILEKKRELDERIRFLKKKKQELYIDMKEGMLTLDDFGAERERLSGMQKQYEKELEEMLEGGKLEKELAEVLSKHRRSVMEMKEDAIPVELLDNLIEKIVVLSPERIEITYAFTDLMKIQAYKERAEEVLEGYVAKYLRISDDDEDIGERKLESNSIGNQRKVLEYYIKNHQELSQYPLREFLDDGFSGVNFQRPGVQKLLKEVKEKRVACIVVKDLSRFGRNYIEVGDYIEQIFPFMGVRFISVSDHYDSFQNPAGIEIGFKSLMHDLYSRDLSRKVKSVKHLYQEQGRYSGGDVPYGYQRNDGKDTVYYPDPEAAQIVKRIFQLASDGVGPVKIAEILSRETVPTPGAYKNQVTGQNYVLRNQKRNLWTPAQVREILQNEVYIGIYICHKLTSVRPREMRRNDRSEYMKF